MGFFNQAIRKHQRPGVGAPGTGTPCSLPVSQSPSIEASELRPCGGWLCCAPSFEANVKKKKKKKSGTELGFRPIICQSPKC